MKESLISNKYITHNSGLPIRVPPYLRGELSHGEPLAQVQVNMMKNDPLVGQRGENDRLPYNMAENVRLRRSAHVASRDLVKQAETLGAKRYTTVVHGSLSKGIVRHPSGDDPSDIDIALVVDNLPLDKEQKRDIYKPLSRASADFYGVKTDVHIWSTSEMHESQADLIRVFLRSAAYPIANVGQLWEQLRWTGLQCQLLLQQDHKVQKVARELIPRIAQGKLDAVTCYLLLRKTYENLKTYEYLTSAGLLDEQYAQTRSSVLAQVIENSQQKIAERKF